MLSFFPRGVLDEILNLIESVSEGFPSYSFIFGKQGCHICSSLYFSQEQEYIWLRGGDLKGF